MLQAYQDQDLLAAKFFDDNNIEAVTDLMACMTSRAAQYQCCTPLAEWVIQAAQQC